MNYYDQLSTNIEIIGEKVETLIKDGKRHLIVETVKKECRKTNISFDYVSRVLDINTTNNRPTGEKVHNSKLNQVDVDTIRNIDYTKTSQVEVAKLYGVSKCTINSIIHNRNWKK